MKLKGLYFTDVAEIQEAVTDELKKVQKEEFSAAFQKLYDCAKACIYASGVFGLTLRLLMSYIYGAPILDVSRSHTTTHHSG